MTDRRNRHIRLIRRFGAAQTAAALHSMLRGSDVIALLTDAGVRQLAVRLVRAEDEARETRRYNRQLAKAS